LIFDYRTVSYLIELKVGRVNPRGILVDEQKPRLLAKRKWHKAIDQLDELHLNTTGSLLRNRIVKLPIVLYFFASRAILKEEDIDYEYVQNNILNYTKEDDKDDNLTPNFYLYSPLPRTPTRMRSTALSSDANIYLYGFSMFAKQIYCHQE
jgi:hypothetical protein